MKFFTQQNSTFSAAAISGLLIFNPAHAELDPDRWEDASHMGTCYSMAADQSPAKVADDLYELDCIVVKSDEMLARLARSANYFLTRAERDMLGNIDPLLPLLQKSDDDLWAAVEDYAFRPGPKGLAWTWRAFRVQIVYVDELNEERYAEASAVQDRVDDEVVRQQAAQMIDASAEVRERLVEDRVKLETLVTEVLSLFEGEPDIHPDHRPDIQLAADVSPSLRGRPH